MHSLDMFFYGSRLTKSQVRPTCKNDPIGTLGGKAFVIKTFLMLLQSNIEIHAAAYVKLIKNRRIYNVNTRHKLKIKQKKTEHKLNLHLVYRSVTSYPVPMAIGAIAIGANPHQ